VRRPIFWFLWPASDPGPLDDAARQSTWLRVCGRGPWRWAFLIAMSATAITMVSASVAAAISQPSVVTAMVTIVIAVPVIALLARAWVAGTYVSDRGVKVSRVLTTEVIAWGGVAAVSTSPGSNFLGLPIRIPGTRVDIATTDSVLATHVESASPDLWLRPQAFAAAHDRLATWSREASG
jgi:hypothetical protein